MDDFDEWDTLRRWRTGERSAGNALFERHVDAVIMFFRTKVDDGVEDLVQDTFLACSRGSSSVTGRGRFRAYLLGVARNVLFDALRSKYRAPFDPLTQSATDLGASPFSELAKQEEQRRIMQAMRALPLDFQITLELVYWQDMSGAEVAEVLQISPNTVRSRLARANERLRDLLSQPELSVDRLRSLTQSVTNELE